jgi:MtN3 and saliva related transmembrane protein
MKWIDVLGSVAGMLTTIAFVPQVMQTWKTRSAKDLSLAMILTFWLGVFLWLIYGLFIQSMPVIVANGVTFLLQGCILWFKLKFKD